MVGPAPDRRRSGIASAPEAGSTHTLAGVMEGLKKKESLKPVTIRMRSDDIMTARGLATQKGIGYQTWIRLLLREALEREAIKWRCS